MRFSHGAASLASFSMDGCTHSRERHPGATTSTIALWGLPLRFAVECPGAHIVTVGVNT